MIYTISKKIILLFGIFWLFFVSSAIYAAAAKPDLIFDSSQTNFSKTSYQADTYNVSFLVKNKAQWSVFKNANTFFNVKCTDKNWKIVKEKKYKWQMKDIKKENFTLNKNKFPITCKIDWENKIAESNENNNSYTMSDITSNNSNANNAGDFDIIINDIKINRDYETLTRGMDNFDMDFVIENKSKYNITINKTNKMIISCSLDNLPLIEKVIDNDVLASKSKLAYIKVTTITNNKIVRLWRIWEYKAKCKVEIKWITESNLANNSKDFLFNVYEADPLPDLVIRDLLIKDWNWNVVQSTKLWNWNIIQTVKLWSEDNYLDFSVYNIGISPYKATNFVDANNNYNNYVFFECYSNVSWEGWETQKFEAWILERWEWQQVIFPNNLFKTFLTKKWTKTINCYLNYNNWTKDKNWNEAELRYDNNSQSFSFEVK